MRTELRFGVEAQFLIEAQLLIFSPGYCCSSSVLAASHLLIARMRTEVRYGVEAKFLIEAQFIILPPGYCCSSSVVAVYAVPCELQKCQELRHKNVILFSRIVTFGR